MPLEKDVSKFLSNLISKSGERKKMTFNNGLWSYQQTRHANSAQQSGIGPNRLVKVLFQKTIFYVKNHLCQHGRVQQRRPRDAVKPLAAELSEDREQSFVGGRHSRQLRHLLHNRQQLRPREPPWGSNEQSRTFVKPVASWKLSSPSWPERPRSTLMANADAAAARTLALVAARL